MRAPLLIIALGSLLGCGSDGGGGDGGGGGPDSGRRDSGTVRGCDAADACTPGEERRSAEGCDAGSRLLFCTTECVFEPVGVCETEECDTPGETVTASCGRCGTRERFCTIDGIWDDSAECTDEGMCMPGTSRMGACGNCGMEEQRCTSACVWEGSGCEGEGECSPGSTRSSTAGCDPGDTRTETCNDECSYEAGVCMGLPGRGEACPGGECEGDLTCDTAEGIPVCRNPCTDSDDCSGGRRCFGSICQDFCEPFTNEGCPPGGKCVTFPFGAPGTGLCLAIGSRGEGERCDVGADCGDAMACVGRDMEPTICARLCDDAHPCAGGQTCDLGSCR
ncbi:MAG: hypothetical protein AAGE52_01800 [Myxococcota bacterium]